MDIQIELLKYRASDFSLKARDIFLCPDRNNLLQVLI